MVLRRSALADALGFTGVDSDANHTFTKGDEQLTVWRSGYWGYSRSSVEGGRVVERVAVACAPNEDCPVPPTTVPQHPADLPSQADATTLALSLQHTAGIDTTNATVTVDDFDDAVVWCASIRMVDGLADRRPATTWSPSASAA